MNKQVAIIGAGPSGLVSIIEFLNYARDHKDATFELHVIEKRTLDFNRRQKLISTMKREIGVYSQFPSLNWEDYCFKTFGSDPTVHEGPNKKLLNRRKFFLKKLAKQQTVFYNPITDFYNLKNFSIKEIQFALLEHIKALEKETPKVKINWHLNSHVSDIDFKTKELQVTEKDHVEKINFDTILNCEGSNGETTALIKKNLPEDIATNLDFSDFNFPTLTHAAVRLKLKPSKNITQFFNQNKTADTDEILLEKFKKLGYTGDKLPNFYIVDDNFYKNDSGKACLLRLFVTSEIPETILDIKNPEEKRETIIKWAKLIAAQRYKISEDHFEFDDKGEDEIHKINALAFKNHLQYVQNPVITLPNGLRIFLVGDAAMSNFYPAGFSSVLALNEACKAVRLVCIPTLPDDEYTKLFNFYRNFLRDELSGMEKALGRKFAN